MNKQARKKCIVPSESHNLKDRTLFQLLKLYNLNVEYIGIWKETVPSWNSVEETKKNEQITLDITINNMQVSETTMVLKAMSCHTEFKTLLGYNKRGNIIQQKC